MKHEALSVTSQALAITSQLLAIGIEVGVIAGGFYIYKKVKAELNPEPEQTPILHTDGEVGQIIQVKKPTWKEKFVKAKKIMKAVIE